MFLAGPLGVLAGLALGGRMQGLAAARFRFVPLLLLALAVQMALFGTALGETGWARSLGPALHVGTMALLLAVLLANLSGWGSRLAVLGAASNLLVIAANGGQMPVRADAVRYVYSDTALRKLAGEGPLSNVRPMDEQTQLAFLGDRFVLPRSMPLTNIVSAGDLCIALGVALWAVELMRAGPGTAGQARRKQARAT